MLKKHRGKSCGQRKDAVQKMPVARNGKIFVICSHCKEERESKFFLVNKKKKTGFYPQCKICRKINAEKYGHSSYMKNYYKTGLGLFAVVKAQDKCYNNHGFNIDKKCFVDWFNKREYKCEYCKKTPVKGRLGLDRKDSNGGYSMDNIVLCCRLCNTLKNKFWSYEDFKSIAKYYLIPKLNGESKV